MFSPVTQVNGTREHILTLSRGFAMDVRVWNEIGRLAHRAGAGHTHLTQHVGTSLCGTNGTFNGLWIPVYLHPLDIFIYLNLFNIIRCSLSC